MWNGAGRLVARVLEREDEHAAGAQRGRLPPESPRRGRRSRPGCRPRRSTSKALAMRLQERGQLRLAQLVVDGRPGVRVPFSAPGPASSPTDPTPTSRRAHGATSGPHRPVPQPASSTSSCLLAGKTGVGQHGLDERRRPVVQRGQLGVEARRQSRRTPSRRRRPRRAPARRGPSRRPACVGRRGCPAPRQPTSRRSPRPCRVRPAWSAPAPSGAALRRAAG